MILFFKKCSSTAALRGNLKFKNVPVVRVIGENQSIDAKSAVSRRHRRKRTRREKSFRVSHDAKMVISPRFFCLFMITIFSIADAQNQN